jgi:hypothetical protein
MNKSFFLSLVALFFLVSISSCDKKNKGNFEVKLNGFVGAQPLSFSNTIYSDGAGKDFFFNRLKFYISEVRLVRTDNTEVDVEDVAYFDYADNNWKSFSVEAPSGEYKGIKFNVGLNPAQNATNPDDFKASDPLGPKDDMFWEWLKHRFINLEGKADVSGGSFVNGVGLVYHVGRDTCYRSVSLSNGNFIIPDEGKKSINLNLDLLKVFKEQPAPIDMFLKPGTQSEDNDLSIAIQFADQFSKSFSYSE